MVRVIASDQASGYAALGTVAVATGVAEVAAVGGFLVAGGLWLASV
jgi:hypothetical protein